MLKDKKGILPLLGLSVGALIVIGIFLFLVIGGLLIFTSVNKYAVIGGGAIALTLIFGLKGEMNKTKAWFMGIIIVGGLIFIFASSNLQSVFSVSSVNVGSDGKVYWVVTGSANSNSPEIYTFTPSKYTFTDGSGTTVTPKDNLMVATSKVNTQCVYQTTKGSYLNPLFQTRYYYTLNNPQKVANVDFTDGNEKTQRLDGTVVQEISISDNDGSGKIRIQTQGLLSGKYNCPNYENVIIFEGDSNYYDRLKWENNRDKILNTAFTNTLTSVKFEGGNVIGEIPIGNVVYTITADQDYFNSVVYTPPKNAEPDVTGINIPSEIKRDSSSSMTVNIKNKVSNSGNIIVTPTSDIATFSPSVTNVNLPSSGSITVAFNVRAINSEKCGNVKVEACGSSQFGDTLCDSYTKNFCIISDNPTKYCGDGVCQSSESYTTCPQDCSFVPPIPEPVCKWYQEVSPAGTRQDCGLLSWKKPLGICETSTYEATCKTSTGIYIIAGIIGAVILGTVFILTNKKKKKKRR